MPAALPTFLGSMQAEGLVGEEEEQPESSGQGGAPEELATFCSSQDQAMMQDCYSKIVEKLSFANPTMVLQVGSYIKSTINLKMEDQGLKDLRKGLH